MKSEIRRPVLNSEVEDPGRDAYLRVTESVISKFRIGPRISNFQTWFSAEIILRLTAMLPAFVTLVIMVFAVVLSGCKKDSPGFLLDSMVIGTIDLTDTAHLVPVPVNPIIVATFNYDVDTATAVPANISLVQEYDHAFIALTLAISGKTISIIPAEDLGSGVLYRLTLKSELKSTGGLSLNEVSYTFTTIGTFSPIGAIAHWNFEDNATDQIGTFNPTAIGIVNITYAPSRNAAAGKAAVFNGTNSIIEIPNGDVLMNTPNFTLSFWLKTNSTGHLNESGKPAGYFVMGLAVFFGLEFEISADFSQCNLAASYAMSDGKTVFSDFLFLGDGKTKDNGGWQADEFCKDLTGSGGVASLLKDKWAQVVCMYEASVKRGTMYINGEKVKVFNFNLWPDGNDRRKVTGLKYSGSPPETVNELAFGFIQSRGGTFYDSDPRYGYDIPTSNHFKGQLDDVRVYHKVLTETEIKLMYDTEK